MGLLFAIIFSLSNVGGDAAQTGAKRLFVLASTGLVREFVFFLWFPRAEPTRHAQSYAKQGKHRRPDYHLSRIIIDLDVSKAL